MDSFELALFPLNTVLFPGMPLHLHIFEERYMKMVHRCLATNREFGVVLIHKGFEALGPLAEPYPIGCTARIVRTNPIEEGRLNLIAIGQERFRTLSLDYESAPYLIAKVEPFPLKSSNSTELKSLAYQLHPWVERYLIRLGQTGNTKLDIPELPVDGITLAFLAAALLELPSRQKQDLISITHAEELLSNLIEIYRREAALLKAMMNESGGGKIGEFSIN